MEKYNLRSKPLEKIIIKGPPGFLCPYPFRISGQKIEMVKKTKYLGIMLDENLSFKYQIENLWFKLNRANGLLAKIRHYVQAGLRRTLPYFALFDSHLRYCCQIWGQNQNPMTNYITI